MAPRRGEIWLVNFSPSIGAEIREPHPALVVSVNELNASPWGLVVVCPLTTFRRKKPFRLHVLIHPPEGGVKNPSVIRLDQVKSVSVERFISPWGEVSDKTMQTSEHILSQILGLNRG